MLNSPQQRRQRSATFAYNSIDVYHFIDFTDYVIRTSVSVNVPQLGVHSVTIRTIFVLRIVSGFFLFLLHTSLPVTARQIASHIRSEHIISCY